MRAMAQGPRRRTASCAEALVAAVGSAVDHPASVVDESAMLAKTKGDQDRMGRHAGGGVVMMPGEVLDGVSR